MARVGVERRGRVSGELLLGSVCKRILMDSG
jgi:hypothetical protein